MKCPSCSFDNPDAFSYCGKCGSQLQSETETQGFTQASHLELNTHHAKQVAAKAAETADAERRQLTVMFCDLVGSTPLAEQLDPEELREILRLYQETCSKVVHRFEGHIARYFGDGLLVYFGYPQAHEDDAHRAVRTGLGILAAMTRLKTRFEKEKGISLDLRLGIHTGLVVAGDMAAGEELETMAVVGETPNIAARLQTLAKSNSLLVSKATQQLVEGFFDCRALGEKRLDGITSPVEVYEVLHESAVRNRLEIAAPRELTPLVGREHLVGLLMEGWEQTREGIGRVMLISGEAGIGKSRLVHALKEHVSEDPRAWLTECRCSPYHQHTAFYPMIDLLERVMLRFGREDAAAERLTKLEGLLVQHGLSLPEAVPLFAELLSLPLDEKYEPLRQSPEERRRRTMEVLVNVLLEIASRQPLLFVVEDLHWIDPSTLELLHLVVNRGPSARIFALFTYRPEFSPPWGGRDCVTQVALNRLTPQQVQEVAEWMAVGKALPDEVMEQVVSKTDGVPLFIEELTKMVLESTFLRETDAFYELTGPLPPLAIPTTLQDSLMARLDRLGAAKETAQLGATFGREFPYEWLQAVTTLGETELQYQIDALIEAELLFKHVVASQASYAFKHALIQEAAYQSLLVSTRQGYHVRIAKTLETHFSEIARLQPELLAHHYTEAGLSEQAVSYWRRAGELAAGKFANREAIEHFGKGLDLVHELEETDTRAQLESELQLGMGYAQHRDGQTLEAMEAFEKAAHCARHAGSTERLARAAIGYEEARWRFNLPTDVGRKLLEEAEQRLGEEDSMLRASVLGALARELTHADPERSSTLSRQAIRLARRADDPEALYSVLRGSLFAHRGPERFEQRQAIADEAMQLAVQLGDKEYELDMRGFLMYEHLESGDLQAVRRDHKIAVELRKAIRLPFYDHVWLIYEATLAYLSGRFQEAEQYAHEAQALGDKLELDVDGPYGLQMFNIRRQQGRLGEVEPLVKLFLERYSVESAWKPGLALIYSELGSMEQARAEFEKLAANDFADFPRDAMWAGTMTYLSEICVSLGDRRRAALLYELLLPYAGCNVMVGAGNMCYGAAGRYLGSLATVLGRWDEAEKHFSEALRLNLQQGAKPSAAHTHREYADMLIARGRTADRVRSMSLLDEALALARELGMKELERKVEQSRHSAVVASE